MSDDAVETIVKALAAALERGEEIKTFSDYPLAHRIEYGWQCPKCLTPYRTEIHGAGFRCLTCGHKWGKNKVRMLDR